ncbi:MAG: DUF2442 domain-containing protein [Deltaproteobacteria bacterium]|nr:DUF2442 domain-containing protein [Deltaproteobacteria bacterium]
MSSPARKIKEYPAITGASVNGDKITAQMSDGREVSIPIAWFPRLLNATPSERSKLEISPGGYGIHWSEVDEDISVKAFLD